MNLSINGETREFAEPATGEFTLALLVDKLAMKPDRVAVELNREIVPRDRWPQTPLKDGDRLEIVHFVGGGCPSRRTPCSSVVSVVKVFDLKIFKVSNYKITRLQSPPALF
jgi:thiamine biosynthesis protein ThiS